MSNFGVLTVVLLGVAMVAFVPFVTIWSLNTLFFLGIEYNIYTWLAVVWIQGSLFGPRFKIKKGD